MQGQDRRDFFISHAGDDEQWARWIAAQLQSEGYTVEIDVLEWAAGENFVALMEAALGRADRVVALYSRSYFTRPFARMEHQAALAASASADRAGVIPVQIEECPIPDLYQALIRISLIGLDEYQARARLLDGVRGGSAPKSRPTFPPHGLRQMPLFPPALPPVWNMRPRNPFFTGRQATLRRLRDRVQASDRSRPTAVVSLQGMGGIGKTQTAVEYSYVFAGDYRIVWWIDAESRELIVDGMLRLGAELGVDSGAPERTLMNVRRALAQRADWLLVYDNVEDLDAIGDLRPPATGHWLLTSRRGTVARMSEVIELGEFDRAESLELLALRAPHLTEADADRVAEALGDLPLAIEQAGYFLYDSGLDAEDYLDLLARTPRTAGLNDPTIDNHAGIASVVETSVARLRSKAPHSLTALHMLSVMAPEAVPITPRRTPEPEDENAAFGIRLGDVDHTVSVAGALQQFGLVKRVNKSLQMHRLTQLLVNAGRTEESLRESVGIALRALDEANPGDTYYASSWPRFAQLLPHFEAIAIKFPCYALTEAGDTSAELSRDLTNYLYRSGRYHAGISLAERLIGAWRPLLDEGHDAILRLENNRANCLNGLERFADAVAAYRRLYDINSRQHGKTDLRTLKSMNNIGYTLTRSGQYQEALDILQVAAAVSERNLGADDIETMRIADNLVLAMVHADRYEEAKDLAERTLVLRQAQFPADHPDTLECRHNLGLAVRRTDEPRGLEMLRAVLADRERVLGVDHPDTRLTRAAVNAAGSTAHDA